jgi:hypothetical protein
MSLTPAQAEAVADVGRCTERLADAMATESADVDRARSAGVSAGDLAEASQGRRTRPRTVAGAQQHRPVSGEHEELLTSVRQAALAVRQAREAQREALRAGHALGVDVAALAAQAGISEAEAHRVITRVPVT